MALARGMGYAGLLGVPIALAGFVVGFVSGSWTLLFVGVAVMAAGFVISAIAAYAAGRAAGERRWQQMPEEQRQDRMNVVRKDRYRRLRRDSARSGSLFEYRRQALAAVGASRRGAQADASMGLLLALLGAESHVDDEKRRHDILGYAAAAFIHYMEAPARDQARFESEGASLDRMATDLAVAIADAGWSQTATTSYVDRVALLRTVAATVEDPFDPVHLEELLGQPSRDATARRSRPG